MECPDCHKSVCYECGSCGCIIDQWISVKDRLPEILGRYFVYEIKEEHLHNCAAFNYPYPCCCVNIAYFRSFQSNDWQWSSFTEMKCNPTHWMPLPQPPKEL